MSRAGPSQTLHTPPERPPLDWPENEPEILPFLPMVYVAWADGHLSPAEMHRIRGTIRQREWLTLDQMEVLDRWLDPAEPPTPDELCDLRRLIERLAAPMGAEERRSLAGLGAAIARAAGKESRGWTSPEGIRTLEAVEGLLGILGDEAARGLVGAEEEEPAPPSPPPPPFDPASMEATLHPDDREVRKGIFELLGTPDFDFPPGIPTLEYRERVWKAVQTVAAAGYGAAGFPPEYGGRDDPASAIAAFQTLAHGDLSVLVKFGVHFGLFGGSVLQLGTGRHHDRYLAAIGDASLPGCYAMTEAGHGSNVREIETVARYDAAAGELVVHTPTPSARKEWIGNAVLHARVATVFAQLEVDGRSHGVHAILVPIRDEGGRIRPGVRIEDCGEKVGLNGVDNGRLWFDGVRVPRENLLNRFGDIGPDGRYASPIPSPDRRFFTMLGTLVTGRISIAAASLSVARTALAIAVRYSAMRRQFGPVGRPEIPVLDYLVHQRALLPRLATTYALSFAIRDLTQRYVRRTPEDQRPLEALAAGLKAFASWHAIETVQACREACGGQGYLAANRFGPLRADCDVFATFEGANAVLLQLVAKGLLTRYREEMGDLKPWGIVRYLADRAGTRVTQLNPVVTRRTDEEHLRDPDFHLDAFRYREDRLLSSVAQRLRRRLDEGADSFQAMNACQDHLVSLATAHVEAEILARFQAAAATASDPGIRAALGTLEALFALSTMEKHRGWYLESGLLDPPKGKAVREMVNRLCGEVRPWAVALVDGFGIPDDVLRAPAAFVVPGAG